jgi:hypothetical protein
METLSKRPPCSCTVDELEALIDRSTQDEFEGRVEEFYRNPPTPTPAEEDAILAKSMIRIEVEPVIVPESESMNGTVLFREVAACERCNGSLERFMDDNFMDDDSNEDSQL